MPWNLLILPLVAGYFLLTRSYFFKFRQQRLEQQRVLFESILLGVGLAVCTYLFRSFFESFYLGKEAVLYVYKFLPFHDRFAGTSFATLILSFLICIFSYSFKKLNFIKDAIDSIGNDFERIIKDSFVNEEMLQFTLSNGKFYIGWITTPSIPSNYNHIRILPAFSGYRDEDSKDLVFTTQYLSAIKDYINEIEKKEEEKKIEIDKKKKNLGQKIKNTWNKIFNNKKPANTDSPEEEEKKVNLKHLTMLHIDIVLSVDNIVSVSNFDKKKYDKFHPPLKNKNLIDKIKIGTLDTTSGKWNIFKKKI